MSNQGFTPGPWRISGYNENMGYPEPVIAGMVSDCTAYVAVCIDCAGMTDANARLIAAAPELLDALTQCRAELLSMIDKHNKQDADDGSWLYDYQTVVEADAAIAKARGTPC